MEKFNRSKPATANLGRSARTHERNPCQGDLRDQASLAEHGFQAYVIEVLGPERRSRMKKNETAVIRTARVLVNALANPLQNAASLRTMQ